MKIQFLTLAQLRDSSQVDVTTNIGSYIITTGYFESSKVHHFTDIPYTVTKPNGTFTFKSNTTLYGVMVGQNNAEILLMKDGKFYKTLYSISHLFSVCRWNTEVISI